MLLIGKDVKYGSSGNTLNAAVTPDLLDANSIGIYAVGSDGKIKLVVPTGTSITPGLILAGSLTSQDKITMFQGLGGGSQLTSETIQIGQIKQIVGSVYRAATPQVVYVGYDPTTGLGDLNAVFYPTSANGPSGLTFSDPDLLYRQECEIRFRERKRGNNEFGNVHYIQVPVVPTDTTLSIANKLVAAANQILPFDTVQYFTAALTGAFLATPVQNNSATATTGGTVPAATYYSTIVFIGANGNSLGSNEKSVVTTGSTSTVTFNWAAAPAGTTSIRVFVSNTAGTYTSYYNVSNPALTTLTITALGSPVAGTVPTGTGIGISLTSINKVIPTTSLYNDETPFAQYSVSVFGVIQNASVTSYGIIDGSGYPYQIRQIERDSMAYRGSLYTLSVLDKQLPSQVNFSATYDLYVIRIRNLNSEKDGTGHPVEQEFYTHVAFEVQGNVPGTDQQADWQSIMTTLYPATPQIS